MKSDKKSNTSFMQFMLCISGYVIFYWVAVYTNALYGWRLWHVLLIPLVPVLFAVGLMMQVIPYEYLKERLEKRNIENADPVALGIWISILVIYGIVLKINADG